MPNPFPILDVPESMLRTKVAPVTSVEQAIDTIGKLEAALATMRKEALGLAANQIGVSLAVTVIARDNEMLHFINPVITSVDDQFIHRGEGCMSFPGRRWDVPRHKTVKADYQALWSWLKPDGSPAPKPMNAADYMPGQPTILVPRQACFLYTDEDNTAVALEHEVEHLLGVALLWKEGAVEVARVPVAMPVVVKGGVGRNDPCPCGRLENGKPVKYKKCCLNK